MTGDTRILLIRHGETEWNNQSRVQGHADVSLSETGRTQAKRLRDHLADEQIDHVYASTLARARETAEIIGERHGHAPTVESDLAEQHFGEWDGEPLDELYGMLDRTETAWTDWAPEGGEHWDDFCERVLSKLRSLRSSHAGETILVVCHGGVNKAILSHATYDDTSRRSEFEQSNACLNELVCSAATPYEVRSVNVTAHLEAEDAF